MPDPSPKLRAVGAGERPPRRRTGPGPAVILVVVYAIGFLAALVYLRRQAIRTRAAEASSTAPAPAADSPPGAGKPGGAGPADLSGAGLDPPAREAYLRRIREECCDCGCELTIEKCLVGDQKCKRSAELAQAALEAAGPP